MFPGVFTLQGASLLRVCLGWQIVGILLMFAHVLLCKESLVFYPVITGLMAWLYFRTPLGGTVVFFQVLLFQNLILSILSMGMDFTTYSALQGTNFVMLVAMAGIGATRTPVLWRNHRAIALALVIAFTFLMLYLAYGLTSVPPTSALVYLREFSAPLIAVVIGIDVGRTWSFRTIGLCFLYSALLSVGLSLVEYCYPLDFYGLTNAVNYYQLKYSQNPVNNIFYTPADVVKNETSALFNITGGVGSDWSNFRFGGTVMHPISNAYVLAVFGLVAVSLRQTYWLWLIMPMMLLIGVKGASILLISCLALYYVWIVVRNVKVLATFAILLAMVYIGYGLYIGMQNSDFHVIGFLGGFHSLLSTPWGHGIGAGGNLSSKAVSGFHWTGAGGFQSAGADFALESAVGVLFYQMGAASLVIFAVFLVLLAKAPLGLSSRYVLPQRSDLMFFALGAIAINGVFQEEAYAPYAAGMLMLFCGVLIGNGRRYSMAEASVARMYTRSAIT